jgi:hypothetical protein
VRLDPSFHVCQLPGDYAQAGYRYGQMCAEILAESRREAFIQAMLPITRTTRDHLQACCERWASQLPIHYQEQIDAMATGASASGQRIYARDVQAFLYADIAAPLGQQPKAPSPAIPGWAPIGDGGPMCSGVLIPATSQHHATRTWAARNCDWHEPTLMRGTAAVLHAIPGRIPCMTVGLMGDIDADTGLNAEGLWLHMHTLAASDEPRAGYSCISWLFWMREALELCSTLREVEAFTQRTDRDRGVMLFACDGKSGEAAIFECSRSGYAKIDPWCVSTQLGHRFVCFATNHCQHKHPKDVDDAGLPLPPRISPSNGTISRYNRLRQVLTDAWPEDEPSDLMEVLADERIEMRTTSPGSSLRTIYSAVASPGGRGSDPVVFFASGACPAASQGTWRALMPRFAAGEIECR